MGNPHRTHTPLTWNVAVVEAGGVRIGGPVNCSGMGGYVTHGSEGFSGQGVRFSDNFARNLTRNGQ